MKKLLSAFPLALFSMQTLAAEAAKIVTSSSQTMLSSTLVQLTKYEQFGAALLRLIPPRGSPSRAGSIVIGNSR